MRSEPFAFNRLRFYEAVQRDLHKGIGPGSQESENFPGFEPMDALVIHAEDATPNGLPQHVQLFIPISDRSVQKFFAEAPRVLLYLYPPNSLIGHVPPTVSPVEFLGAVTMQNDVFDAPVTARAANCLINDLSKPRINLLPSGTVPSPSGELYQVVIRFDPNNTGDLPVYHSGENNPKMKLGVEYRIVDRDEYHESTGGRRDHDDHRISGKSVEPPPEYLAPQRLTVRSSFRVPSQDLYRNDIRRLLNYVLMGTDFFDESTVPEFKYMRPDRIKSLTGIFTVLTTVYQRRQWHGLQSN